MRGETRKLSRCKRRKRNESPGGYKLLCKIYEGAIVLQDILGASQTVALRSNHECGLACIVDDFWAQHGVLLTCFRLSILK